LIWSSGSPNPVEPVATVGPLLLEGGAGVTLGRAF
jgi:hypothetical protein